MSHQHVCFVIPPSPFLSDERVFMSLGVLKVASAVETTYPVDVLDLSGVANFEDVVEEYILSRPISSIGITVTTPQLPSTVAIIKKIRQLAQSLRIILGGPHITLVYAAYVREQKKGISGRATSALQGLKELADVLVVGEGEKAVFLALEPSPPKIVNADDPTSPLFLGSDDLNELPWPARHLIDTDSYHYFIDGERALSIVSQLGCPFGCGFCGGRYSASLRRMRSRSMQSVLAEMEHLYVTYGVKGFMFYDDELNVNHKLITALLTGVIDLQFRLGVEFRLRGFVKSQLFNDEQARLMYKAGFRWLLTGFESASPEILVNMNKMATVAENTNCVEIAKANGLKVKALMSIGHPGESYKTAAMTHDWLLKVKPDDFDISLISVYPGTPYYDDAVPHPQLEGVWVYSYNGAKLYCREVDYRKVSDYYKGNPSIGCESFVYTDYLKPHEIVNLRNNIDHDIRNKLGIPNPTSSPATIFEHSTGQSGLPKSILKSTLTP